MAKVTILCLLLAGCGSFPLAASVYPPTGKTVSDERLDLLECKDRAHNYAASDEKQVRGFLLGLTVIGAPVAYAADRSDQRTEFRACMEDKGYRVVGVE